MSKDFPFLSLSLHCHLIIDSSTRFLKWWIRHLGTKDSASATPGNAPDLCFPTNNGISKIEINNLWRATYGLEKKTEIDLIPEKELKTAWKYNTTAMFTASYHTVVDVTTLMAG